MYQPSPLTIGQRVRLFRDWREMTLEQVAGLAGMSRSWLSNIERGETPLYQRKHIDALAEALKVSPSDLTGVASAENPGQAVSEARIDAVRDALLDAEFGSDTDLVPRPLPELVAEAERTAVELLMYADYERTTLVVPGQISELRAHLSAGTDTGAVRALTMACATAATAVKALGYRDLAVIAAEEGRRTAELTGQATLLGYADIFVAHAMEPYARSYRHARTAADTLTAEATDDMALRMLGMLHLFGGLGAAVGGDMAEATARLDEADRLAARLGEDPSMGTWFGPTNAGIWRVSIAVEAQEGGRVAEYAARIDPKAIPSQSRQSTYWMDIGRGLAQEGRHDRAVEALAKAERLAPQQFRNNPLAREAVTGILTQARRSAGGATLHGMARRMNIY